MVNPQKILVIQLKRAGDVILTTPIAAILKGHWPQSRVHFLVDQAFAPLLEHNPAIDAVQVYDKSNVWKTLQRLRAERYDSVLDFQSSPRSAVVTLASGAAITVGFRVPFWGRVYRQTVWRPNHLVSVVRGKISMVEALTGSIIEVPEPRIYLTPEEKTWAQGMEIEAKGRDLVALIPTHRRASRRWHEDSFAALANRLDQSGYAVWLFWGPGERDEVERIRQLAPKAQLIPPATLRQMAALLACCRLVVSNDNGPMHVAAAVGTPTVTVYGPTDPRAWNPGGPRHQVIQATDVTCLGCNLNQCPFEHECMTHVSAQQVYAACEKILGDFAFKVCGEK